MFLSVTWNNSRKDPVNTKGIEVPSGSQKRNGQNGRGMQGSELGKGKRNLPVRVILQGKFNQHTNSSPLPGAETVQVQEYRARQSTQFSPSLIAENRL